MSLEPNGKVLTSLSKWVSQKTISIPSQLATPKVRPYAYSKRSHGFQSASQTLIIIQQASHLTDL